MQGKSAKTASKKSAAEQSAVNMARTGVGKAKGRGDPPTDEREGAASLSKRPPCEKCGQVHRRCSGHTRNGPNAGKPCGANPPAGQPLCIKHGGNHPAHKKKAKERLLELVDPALAALHKVLTGDADDAVKVRAALGILDRTGFGPGQTVTLQPGKWDDFIAEAAKDGLMELDRSLPNALGVGGGETMPLGYEDVEQHVHTAREEAWAEYDHEDAVAAEQGRIYPTSNTVTGEVLGESILPEPMAKRPKPSEYGEAPYPGRYDVPRDRPGDAPPRYTPEDE